MHAEHGGHSGHRRWKRAFPRLSQFAVEHLLLLPLGAGLAIAWANLWPESYFTFSYAAAFVVNDIALVFFFALMTKEVVEATAPNGVLHPWRRALLPVMAAIGIAAITAQLQIVAAEWLDEPMLSAGWPITFATDLAFSYFIARLIFKPQHPAIPFLILLGIASDSLGFVAVAIFNPTRDLRLGIGAILLLIAMTVASGLQRAKVRSFWPYLATAGSLSWFALYWSGLHPALALVPVMPFLPHAARDPGFFVDAKPGAKDTLSQFEVFWRYPVQLALFFFGLVNAGVPFGALEQGTWALPFAVLTGKPIGLLLAAGLAVVAGLHLPRQIGWKDLIVIGFVAAMGFSVGLFFCAALFPPGQLRSEMSMGVLVSLFGGLLALIACRIFRVGRFAHSTG
jgi:Na+:H+ antiporter, NhaA family